MLRLTGEIDIARREHVVSEVDALCRKGHRRVQIDLAEVTFIDAAAVGTFVTAQQRAATSGCELTLTHVQGFPLRVLRMLLLDTLLIDEVSSD